MSYGICTNTEIFNGASKSFDLYNEKWRVGSKGGYLKIEIMPSFEMPVSRSKLKRQEWNDANSDVIKQSEDEYNKKRSVVGFRPTPEIREWLDEERWEDNSIPSKNSIESENY